MEFIDAAAMEKAIRELAEENPDFVYCQNVCVYTDREGVPSCIVGQALARIGFDVPAYNSDRAWYWRETQFITGESWNDLFDASDETRSIRKWAEGVQQLQDDKTPWGEAVRLADQAKI